MYKHKHNGWNAIGVTDDNGNYHAWKPGQIITLNRKYIELEQYGIMCIDKEQNTVNVHDNVIKPIKIKKTNNNKERD